MDLGIQYGFYVFDVTGVGKIQDVFDVQQVLAGHARFLGIVRTAGTPVLFGFIDSLFIFLYQHDIGMILGNPDQGAVRSMEQLHDDIEDQSIVHSFHLHGHLFQEFLHLCFLLRCHVCNYFQLFFRFASNDPGRSRRFDAVQAVRIGHHHALHVLDDIPADADFHPVRQGSQDFPGPGRGVGNRNGLGTSHGRHQFFLLESG